MAVAPTTSGEWHLHIAITDAALDHREAPWYGPWNIILRDFIFLSFCQPPYMTITYPQFPVSTMTMSICKCHHFHLLPADLLRPAPISSVVHAVAFWLRPQRFTILPLIHVLTFAPHAFPILCSGCIQSYSMAMAQEGFNLIALCYL